MIKLYDADNLMQSCQQGQYVLVDGDTPYRSYSAVYFSMGMAGPGPNLHGHALCHDRTNTYYSDEVEHELSFVASRKVRAVCDTVAEVNTLIGASIELRTAYIARLGELNATLDAFDGVAMSDDAPGRDEVVDDEYRAFTLLNNSGDNTITWEKENDDVMRLLIEKKLSEGMAFFIVPPKTLGFIPKRKKRVTELAEAMKHRSLSVKDNDFAEIIAAGLADVRERPSIDTEKAVQSFDPREISRSQSVGVMPMRGG